MMESSSNNDGWTRYYDTDNKSFYWYNSITGESQWDDDQTHYAEDGISDKQSLIHNPEPPIPNHLRIKEPVSETATSLPESIATPPTSDEVYFWRFMYVNAVLVEAPLCVIEAFLRAIALTTIVILLLFYSIIVLRSIGGVQNQVRLLLRDITLTIVAGLALLVPGVILYLYRNFRPNEDWNLSLLPTPLGRIDCRRFLLLTVFGSASLARNVNDDSNNNTNNEREVWENSIYCLPRPILLAFTRLQSREGP